MRKKLQREKHADSLPQSGCDKKSLDNGCVSGMDAGNNASTYLANSNNLSPEDIGTPKDPQVMCMIERFTEKVIEIKGTYETSRSNIGHLQELMQLEGSDAPMSKKRRRLLELSLRDVYSECDAIQSALDIVHALRCYQHTSGLGLNIMYRTSSSGGRPKRVVRRGVLMSMLQTDAKLLPLWSDPRGQSPPPLCGSIPPRKGHVAKMGDMVAALITNLESEEETYILGEVSGYNSASEEYDVDDIDAEDGKERYTLLASKVIFLPHYRANPEMNPEALFEPGCLVFGLYPQTTCFYKALVYKPPSTHDGCYLLRFEDPSYANGYSPELEVEQKYVIPYERSELVLDCEER